MNRAARIAAALFGFACAFVVVVARPAAAATMDPFRPTSVGAARAKSTRSPLLPFRTAQAPSLPDQPPDPPPPPLPLPLPPRRPRRRTAAAPAAKSCQKDEDCPEGNICADNVCRVPEPSTNVFPIYYSEGSFKEIMLLWWQRKAPTGYTVFAPFYWHYYSPTSDFLAVAPFYWRSEDRARNYRLTVIPPFSWSSEPGAGSFAIWPIFYGSSKYGWAVPLAGTFRIKNPEANTSFGAALALYWWRRAPDKAFDLGVPLFVSWRSSASAFTYALPLNVLLAQQGRREPAGAAAVLLDRRQERQRPLHRLGYRTRDGHAGQRVGVVAVLVLPQREERQRLRPADPPALLPIEERRAAHDDRHPAGVELLGADVAHDGRRAAVPGSRQRQLVLQRPVPRAGGAAGDRATGSGFTTLLPLLPLAEGRQGGHRDAADAARRLHARQQQGDGARLHPAVLLLRPRQRRRVQVPVTALRQPLFDARKRRRRG